MRHVILFIYCVFLLGAWILLIRQAYRLDDDFREVRTRIEALEKQQEGRAGSQRYKR